MSHNTIDEAIFAAVKDYAKEDNSLVSSTGWLALEVNYSIQQSGYIAEVSKVESDQDYTDSMRRISVPALNRWLADAAGAEGISNLVHAPHANGRVYLRNEAARTRLVDQMEEQAGVGVDALYLTVGPNITTSANIALANGQHISVHLPATAPDADKTTTVLTQAVVQHVRHPLPEDFESGDASTYVESHNWQKIEEVKGEYKDEDLCSSSTYVCQDPELDQPIYLSIPWVEGALDPDESWTLSRGTDHASGGGSEECITKFPYQPELDELANRLKVGQGLNVNRASSGQASPSPN